MLFDDFCKSILGENVDYFYKRIDHFIKKLDEDGRIILNSRSDVDNLAKAFAMHNIEISDYHSDGVFMITRPYKPEPAPELVPWDVRKKELEKQRIKRGFPHPGNSDSIMRKRQEKRQTYGHKSDNTFGYGKKDSKGNPDFS